MLIFDQLKKKDPELRTVTLAVLAGLGTLLVGLWWVQIVSTRDYQETLETQSFRTIRIPAVRGKILDRNGTVLAENRPTYNVSLYLEELSKSFRTAGAKDLAATKAQIAKERALREKQLGRWLTKAERKQLSLKPPEKELIQEKARYEVASNVVIQVSQRLGRSLWLNPTNFERHYETRLALPLPVATNLDATTVARFEEQSTDPLGVDLQMVSTRVYPHGAAAAHVLGHLTPNNDSVEGEEAFFSYRLPDYRGDLGIEFGYDKELRGMAGEKSVLVNNVGYRQTENVWSPAQPGHTVVLTIDLSIQEAAEMALRNTPFNYTPPLRGAAVVMDVRNGDILAMASWPTPNPNWFIQGLSREEWERFYASHAEKNRATQENYFPGSIFKLVVGLAALEAGLNPQESFRVAENPNQPGKGYIIVRGHPIKDTARPGDYDFRRALMLSSNSYFITNGLRTGPEHIVRLGQRFHLGERAGLNTRQEVSGFFPRLERVTSGWSERNTANLSIGQDPVYVTPLQVAVMVSAIANGGTVLWPRLVDRIESQDPLSGEEPMIFPSARVRDELGVSQRSLSILQEAMLADTEDPEGTGKHVRDHHPLPGLHICGKTGTAQVQDVHGEKKGQITWFASFAPYGPPGSGEKPRWAVVVMVEEGKSGGDTCSPVAGDIYDALMKREQRAAGSRATLANAK
jgi:penicillin-binding protein 2